MRSLLTVVRPGLLTTIQDLGRPGAIAAGVPPGGAADRFAHRAANLLVGNAPQEATLECTIAGPALVAETACLVAITGADLAPEINGSEAPMWTSLRLSPGDTLAFGPRRTGARAYVALAGGFEGDRWLGSRSTSLLAGLGGMRGRALQAGDSLAGSSEPAASAIPGRRLEPELGPDYAGRVLLAMPGPHLKRLDAEGRTALFSSPFQVSSDSDRMGCRLEGPALAISGEEVLSFGLVAGALQVPGSGQPILLLADHQTAGGYPVVATVVSASMPVAAQLAPGDEVRFRSATAAQAAAGRKALSEALATLTAG